MQSDFFFIGSVPIGIRSDPAYYWATSHGDARDEHAVIDKVGRLSYKEEEV